jgi:UDP-arabinose 4-epimerase
MPQRIPISEDHPQRPISPYGHSKLFVERLLADLGIARGLRSISLRYFNAAGADPNGEIGEAHDPETHLIPLAIAAACSGSAVQIFGTDYDTPDGTCVRDYVHVWDIADAHVRALKHLLRGGESCALNLANARGYSVKEVIATVERVCGCSVRTEIAPRGSGDPPKRLSYDIAARRLPVPYPVRRRAHGGSGLPVFYSLRYLGRATR